MKPTRISVAGIGLLVACTGGDQATGEARPTVNAATVVVVARPFTETLEAIGTVTGRSGHVATLGAPAPTRVSQVLVTAGQIVAAGQPLIVLDPSSFLPALQSAEAALVAAERNAERQQRLAAEGIIPRKDAEQAAADAARARAGAVEARRFAELSTLRSPISGVVTRLAATMGASVDASAPLVEISDPTALDVLLNVTPANAARVQPGQKVALTAGQSAGGEPLGIGTVVDVSGTVDSTTRGIAVRVRAPTTRRPMRIGETVFGSIGIGTRPRAIVVPAEAIVPEGSGFRVYVVDGNGIAHGAHVTIGGRSAEGVEITAGLHAGDRVVTYGAYGVQDSVKILPVGSDTSAASPAQP